MCCGHRGQHHGGRYGRHRHAGSCGCYVITGGTGGPTVTVSNYDDLEVELTSSGPRIVKICGKISGSDDIPVESDKTIVGICSNSTIATIDGFGFRIKAKENIVIRNLNFINASNDSIEIETEAHHIWIDHNSLSCGHDGLIDIKRGSSWITVSWNRFFNHDKTMLLGHSDCWGHQDVGKLKVTYHHNWFDGTAQRHPRASFGEVHVLNNFYDAVTSYGAASTMNASVLVEANYFKDVTKPTDLQQDSCEKGNLEEVNNVCVPSVEIQTRGTVFDPRAYYSYTPDCPYDIPSKVSAGAGAGKLTSPEVWTWHLPCRLFLAPDGMDIDPCSGLISWNPEPTQLGDHLVTVEVSDAEVRSGAARSNGLSVHPRIRCP